MSLSRSYSFILTPLKFIAVGLFGAFVILPTVFIFPLALNRTDVLSFPPQGLGFRHFNNVLHSPVWLHAFGTSFEVAGAAAAVATVVGTVAALVLPVTNRWLARPLELAAVAPLVIPPVVLAIAWYSLFSRLHMIGSMTAVILGLSVLGLPIVYLNVVAGLANFDHDLVLAARSLGGRPPVVFGRIVLPLTAPSIIAGLVLAFVLAFDELIITLFVGGGVIGTLPVQMWAQIGFNATPDVAAVAAVSVLITLGGFALATALWRWRSARAS